MMDSCLENINWHRHMDTRFPDKNSSRRSSFSNEIAKIDNLDSNNDHEQFYKNSHTILGCLYNTSFYKFLTGFAPANH